MRTAVLVSAIVLAATPAAADDAPRFQVDASWPQTLPNNWIMGQAAGIAVDAQDHVWVVQRPDLTTTRGRAQSADQQMLRTAPPVMEFDPDGKLVQAWGGGRGYNWPQNEHGVSTIPRASSGSVATAGRTAVSEFTRRQIRVADRQARRSDQTMT